MGSYGEIISSGRRRQRRRLRAPFRKYLPVSRRNTTIFVGTRCTRLSVYTARTVRVRYKHVVACVHVLHTRAHAHTHIHAIIYYTIPVAFYAAAGCCCVPGTPTWSTHIRTRDRPGIEVTSLNLFRGGGRVSCRRTDRCRRRHIRM